jgi:hypothetical protein
VSFLLNSLSNIAVILAYGKLNQRNIVIGTENQAYAVLVNKCQEVERWATKNTAAKTINSFRSVFRKELLKVMKSARSGAGADDLYKPSLWYFNLLSFLNDHENPRESISDIEEDSEQEVSYYHIAN